MKIVQLSGGLGNQMSQYAMGRLLELKYGQDVKYYVMGNAGQGYELERVFAKVKVEYVSRWEVFVMTRTIAQKGRKMGKWVALFNKIAIERNAYDQKYESGYPEDKALFESAGRDVFLRGTFHNYDYTYIDDTLLEEFSFGKDDNQRNIELMNEMSGCQSVGIHVRRGDYVSNGIGIVGEEYYRKAMEYVSSRVSDCRYYIFSDDSEWVRENMTFVPDPTIVDWNTGKSSYRDMQLMSACKHNIIANSTFSYWAAKLNVNRDKIVVKPRWQTSDRLSWVNKGWIAL